MGKSKIDGDAPPFLFLQAVGVDSSEGSYKGGLAVIDVSRGPGNDVAHGSYSGTTIIGVVLGAGDPASGSTETATAPREATSTGPASRCRAEPSVDWNKPAGRGAPP